MITTKKHVMTTALTALMLAGIIHEWLAPAPVRGPYSVLPAVSADSTGGGFICLDTKFFLPFRSEGQLSADKERRETLRILLTTYENR